MLLYLNFLRKEKNYLLPVYNELQYCGRGVQLFFLKHLNKLQRRKVYKFEIFSRLVRKRTAFSQSSKRQSVNNFSQVENG